MNQNSHRNGSFRLSLHFLLLAFLFPACSSVQPVKTQAYAQLNHQRTFENDFPTVWKGIEGAFRNFKVTQREPDEVDALELKKMERRKLETDWIYTQSRDKFVEFKVNGFPRKQYLQTRLRYVVHARRVMGGVDVDVVTAEEIEKLKEDGSPAGYDESASADSSRANEILEKIQNSILSAAP